MTPRRFLALVCATVAMVTVAAGAAQQTPPAQSSQRNAGWTLPADADTLKNPLAGDEKAIAAGKAIYKDKCSRCHGPGGLGDGPDAEPDHPEMDLTDAKRAERNPDGVVFHKVANGRRRPRMPAFKDELSEQQIWSVVAYVQTMRKK